MPNLTGSNVRLCSGSNGKISGLVGLVGSAFIDFFQDKSQTDQSITEGSRPIRMLAPSLPVRAICPLMCHS